jgi:pilus assembly protein CpaC
MTKILAYPRLLLVALMALVLAAPASAQIGAQHSVEINKGKLVRLPANASTVVVADPDIADVQVLSPTLIYISGRKIGETSVLAIDGKDTVVLDGTVSVTHNLSKLKDSVTQSLPASTVEFDSTDSAIVLKGDVQSPYQAERIQKLASTFLRENQSVVNFLNAKDGDQVLLKVKVAEVSRTELKRFGINLNALLSAGDIAFSLATNTLGAGLGALGNTLTSSASDLTTVVEALENDGLLTILAEPNLTTKSGVTANFLAGGEFPIPVQQGGQQQGITIEYRQFGVSLDFTPVVLSADKISLSVRPEVSSLSQTNSVMANGFNIPTLLTRRASTTVELGSGESFAIAGLLRRDDSNDINKVPGLGELPILGALFRSNRFQNEQTELVIIITPYIVRGVANTELATPLDNYRPATDLERILMGRLYGETNETTLSEEKPYRLPKLSQHDPRLHGPVGFILR